MTPRSLCLLVLLSTPALAAAQTPDSVPAPPAAPASPAAPAPVIAPMAPAAPTPMAMPDGRLRSVPVPPVVPSIGPGDLNIDVNLDELRDQMYVVRDRVRMLADDSVQRSFAKIDSQDFAFQSGPAAKQELISRALSGKGTYDGGLNSLQRHQYEQAITQFDNAIAQKGPRADGALYWKAFAQYKLGKSDEALASLTELRKSYAQSRYLGDARVLEADVRKTTGRALTGDDDNDEIKLLAISSLQTSNPDGAIPLLEGVLKATNSLAIKKRALFVLAQNDQPAAHQVLVNYAKGTGNPDLQVEAVRYLAARKRQTSSAELMDIYNSTSDVDVRRAVLGALGATGDASTLYKIASSAQDADVRKAVFSTLSAASLATPQELMQLYQKEENADLRQAMVRGFSSMGAVDQLLQIVKTDKAPAVRQQAIRALGDLKSDRTGPILIEMYSGEQDKDTKKMIVTALANQNNAEGLVSLARKETSSDMKLQIVRRIADMAPRNKVAMDFLMEQIK